MTQFLPPNLLALFAPNPPLDYKPPLDVESHERKYPQPLTGIARYVAEFENPADAPKPTKAETREQKEERKRKEREERNKTRIETQLQEWNKQKEALEGDPFKTLFVGRLNYDTSESRLRKELDYYGPIKSLKMVQDKEGKPRGYAFVEFEHERDLHSAYKRADGQKIDDKRIVVDVERGRTVTEWLPRRLGGGLGGTRRGAPSENSRVSGREVQRDRERDRSDRDDRSDRRDRDDRGRGRDRDRDDDRRSRREYHDRDNLRESSSSRHRSSSRRRDRSSDRSDRDRHRSKRHRSRDRSRDKDDKDHDRSSRRSSRANANDEPLGPR